MVSSMNRNYIIPPYWGDILLGFIITSGGVYLIEFSRTHNLNIEGGYYAILLIGLVLLLVAFRHYSVDAKGVVIRYLWIPVYRVPWNRISTVEYIEKWNIGNVFGKHGLSGERKGCAIVVVCKDCPPFCAEVDALHMFLIKHPFSAHFLRFSKKKCITYINAFRFFYPTLSFQIGVNIPVE